MDLVALQIFKAVAEAGGITRAAARLHRVQSNVTTRVKQLEAQPRRAAFPPPAPAPRALRGGPHAARLRRAPARAFRGGPRRAEERRAARRAAHRLAREHRGDAPAAGALALSPRLPRGAPRAGDGHFRRSGRKSPEWRRRGGVRRRALHRAGTRDPARLQRGAGADRAEGLRRDPRREGQRRTCRCSRSPPAAPTACAWRAGLAAPGCHPSASWNTAPTTPSSACVAAGSGIAVVPRSVIRALRPEREVRIHRLPKEIAASTTRLVWRQGHRSAALDALRSLLREAPARPAAGSRASRSAARRPSAARPPRRSSAPASSR